MVQTLLSFGSCAPYFQVKFCVHLLLRLDQEQNCMGSATLLDLADVSAMLRSGYSGHPVSFYSSDLLNILSHVQAIFYVYIALSMCRVIPGCWALLRCAPAQTSALNAQEFMPYYLMKS
jgi:hypothetical protein